MYTGINPFKHAGTAKYALNYVQEYNVTHRQFETTCTQNEQVLFVHKLTNTYDMHAHTITNTYLAKCLNIILYTNIANMYTTKENTPSVADR